MCIRDSLHRDGAALALHFAAHCAQLGLHGRDAVALFDAEPVSYTHLDVYKRQDGTTVSSGMTTAQVAKMVSPSVVVITTEQVVYSQWSCLLYTSRCV